MVFTGTTNHSRYELGPEAFEKLRIRFIVTHYCYLNSQNIFLLAQEPVISSAVEPSKCHFPRKSRPEKPNSQRNVLNQGKYHLSEKDYLVCI
jgi:hypothetical protein